MDPPAIAGGTDSGPNSIHVMCLQPYHDKVGFAGNKLIMQTDWQAPNGRIVAVDREDPAREKWREIVPASGDSIQGFTLAGGKLFVNYLHNVASTIKIFSIDGARLQAATASDRPVLLLYDKKAGHAGGTPLSKAINDLALKMSFLFWQLQMN